MFWTEGGTHQLCIKNENWKKIEVEITIKTGDWTDSFLDDKSITRIHLHPVEIQAFKMNEMVRQLVEVGVERVLSSWDFKKANMAK
jgi:hypothetical protein